MNKFTVILLLVLSGPAQAGGQASSQPLFDSHEVLELDIQLPFKEIDNNRQGKPVYFPGDLQYIDEQGQSVRVEIDLRTRGNKRRKAATCEFPPLRIRMHEGQQGTLFEHQDVLKLVTHCQNKNIYDQYVLKEYLAYRIYNLFTNYSVRARLALITYREGDAVIARRYGILLEHWKQIARRTDSARLNTIYPLKITELAAYETSLLGLFQYLIGNDDWSTLWPAEDADCCHNVRPVIKESGTVIPIPYDFDYSGLVEAKYAISRKGTNDVRKRRYLGYCGAQSGFAQALQHIQSKHAEVLALVDELEALRSRERGRTLRYFEKYFAVLSDPATLAKRVTSQCRDG